MHEPPSHSAPSLHVWRQPVHTARQVSPGPQFVQRVPGPVPSGQGTGQSCSVQLTTWPCSHLHELQLNGSSTLAPCGQTSPLM